MSVSSSVCEASDSTKYRLLRHHLVVVRIAIAQVLPAEGPSPLKSQITATESSSPPCRANVNPSNLLTSHNGRTGCSEAISCSPQLTARHPYSPVPIARLLHATRRREATGPFSPARIAAPSNTTATDALGGQLEERLCGPETRGVLGSGATPCEHAGRCPPVMTRLRSGSLVSRSRCSGRSSASSVMNNRGRRLLRLCRAPNIGSLSKASVPDWVRQLPIGRMIQGVIATVSATVDPTTSECLPKYAARRLLLGLSRMLRRDATAIASLPPASAESRRDRYASPRLQTKDAIGGANEVLARRNAA